MASRESKIFTRFGVALALALGAAAPARAADERFTVCSITINSDDEIRTLRERLPRSEFRFVELTDFATERGGAWFDRACASRVRCDVVVLSAHFGNTYAGNYGTTFAGRSGHTLALEDLERKRCQASCPGILEDPLEVYLLGCKTLSTTLDGEPLPADDVDRLAAHGLPRAAATRLYDEMRYGLDGTDNRERMRFVFSGVPHLYGFTEVGPSGRQAAPLLEDYLEDVGDYAAHLERLARNEALGAARPDNRALADAFAPTCFAETRGWDLAGDDARLAARSCALRPEDRTAAASLAEIERRLGEPGFVASLPAIAAALAEIDPATLGAEEHAALDRIRTPSARSRRVVDELLGGLETPILRLELLRAALDLGWIEPAAALPAQRAIVVDLLRPPLWGEARDRICGLGADVLGQIELRAEEVPPETYENEFGIQALACLQPADERIHTRLAGSLDDARDWIVRLTAGALRTMRATGVQVQIALAEQLDRPEGEARSWVAEALRSLAPSDPRVLTRIRAVDPSFVLD